MEIATNRLFQANKDIWLGVKTVKENSNLWLMFSRKSSLGGYIGYFQYAYNHTSGTLWSPGHDEAMVISMESVRPIEF